MQPVDTAYADTLEATNKTEKLNRYRDIIRKTALGAQFIILGIENQSNVHYAMPLRVMLYDALGYSAECKLLGATQDSTKWTLDEFLSKVSKGTKLTPIFTIVFYTGEAKWDGPRSLYDMLAIDEKLQAYIPDYPIHVIDIGHDNYDFQTQSLRELSHVLHAIYEERSQTDTTEISNSILSLAGILSGTPILYKRNKGGKTVMCNAIEKLIYEETTKAKLEQLIELVQDNLLSVTDAAKKAGLSEVDFLAAMNK